MGLEEEKTKSFELGRVSKLEDLGKEFHRRAGDAYAETRTDDARFLKELAHEFEDRGKRARDKWNEKHTEREE